MEDNWNGSFRMLRRTYFNDWPCQLTLRVALSYGSNNGLRRVHRMGHVSAFLARCIQAGINDQPREDTNTLILIFPTDLKKITKKVSYKSSWSWWLYSSLSCLGLNLSTNVLEAILEIIKGKKGRAGDWKSGSIWQQSSKKLQRTSKTSQSWVLQRIKRIRLWSLRHEMFWQVKGLGGMVSRSPKLVDMTVPDYQNLGSDWEIVILS